MTAPILPGATIGILGGGQLGRMLVLAGRALGYRFHVFEPSGPSPAGAVADAETNAPYSDLDALRQFARSVDVATIEFENIPRAALDVVAAATRVHPSPEVLHICQNRQREKTFLRESGLPHAPFAIAESPAALAEAITTLGFPSVVKTADFGYDGKGQRKLTEMPSPAELAELWESFGNPSRVVIESWIGHTGEFSVLCARSETGETSVLPVAENEHRHHILHRTIAPARLSPDETASVIELGKMVAAKLNLVGLIAVELFRLPDGSFLINEMAPRPHNSGHFSIEACEISQFELLLRAACGLPLPANPTRSAAVMINLLGDVWQNGTPDWPTLLAEPSLHLHLYDKGTPRPGRKMGHFTLLGTTAEPPVSEAEAAFAHLTR